MRALTPTEQINLLRKEKSAQTAKIRELEADLAYLAMMVVVDLGKGGTADAEETKEDKQNV